MLLLQQATPQHLPSLLHLYTFLKDNPMPPVDNQLLALWNSIISDPNHHVIMGFQGDMLVSSCILVVVPNLTHGQRPYALIENVITHPDYRQKGYASQVMDFAKNIAKENNCYKIMLMTSSKKESTLTFYKKAGYNTTDKTAFVQWL